MCQTQRVPAARHSASKSSTAARLPPVTRAPGGLGISVGAAPNLKRSPSGSRGSRRAETTQALSGQRPPDAGFAGFPRPQEPPRAVLRLPASFSPPPAACERGKRTPGNRRSPGSQLERREERDTRYKTRPPATRETPAGTPSPNRLFHRVEERASSVASRRRRQTPPAPNGCRRLAGRRRSHTSVSREAAEHRHRSRNDGQRSSATLVFPVNSPWRGIPGIRGTAAPRSASYIAGFAIARLGVWRIFRATTWPPHRG